MKKIILPMLTLFAGVAFTACEDQLDIPQKATVTTGTFYQADADCEKALASAYENFQINTVGRTTLGPSIYTPGRVLANHPGDDVNYGGAFYGDHEFGGAIDEFRYLHTPDAITSQYKGFYLSIYTDNLVLEYFKDATTDFQKQAVAEARVLRAYNYFLLACYWGTPPFIDHILSSDETPTNSDAEGAPENAPKIPESSSLGARAYSIAPAITNKEQCQRPYRGPRKASPDYTSSSFKYSPVSLIRLAMIRMITSPIGNAAMIDTV
jgi:hypothetical protein